ncbi:MAG: GNAT family N-acetyltransferase [Edaphobacter sp.]
MSVAGFQVRFAVAGDLAEVVALERGVAEAPHWAETEYAAIVSESESEGAVRRCFFVAEAAGRLIGFAVGKVIGLGSGGAGEVESVVVSTAARRGGVGMALCTAILDWCKGQGAAGVELEVRVGSAGAIALYSGLGFVVAGRRGWYYKDPAEDALLMRLDLVGFHRI